MFFFIRNFLKIFLIEIEYIVQKSLPNSQNHRFLGYFFLKKFTICQQSKFSSQSFWKNNKFRWEVRFLIGEKDPKYLLGRVLENSSKKKTPQFVARARFRHKVLEKITSSVGRYVFSSGKKIQGILWNWSLIFIKNVRFWKLRSLKKLLGFLFWRILKKSQNTKKLVLFVKISRICRQNDI